MTDVLTGGVKAFPTLDFTATSLERAEAERRHQIAVEDHSAAVDGRRKSIRDELDERTEMVGRRTSEEMLRQLSDAGMSWRDVARVVDVTVPAVQKWRKGGDIAGPNRLRLARLVAVLELLGDHLVPESVSWLEMPVRHDVSLSRMDLLAEGRHDLVIELVSDEATSRAPEAVLDAFDPAWRDSLTDRAFEAYEAGDGRMSVRPKR